eukprot:5358013-Ditylum_brightwellii.AAC.1
MWGRTVRRRLRCWMPWRRLARVRFLDARWVAQLPRRRSPLLRIRTGVHGLQQREEASSWDVDRSEMKELGAGREVDTHGLS